MSYVRDVKLLRRLPVQDPELRFSDSQGSGAQPSLVTETVA
jgi:hypothetical protein